MKDNEKYISKIAVLANHLTEYSKMDFKNKIDILPVDDNDKIDQAISALALCIRVFVDEVEEKFREINK